MERPMSERPTAWITRLKLWAEIELAAQNAEAAKWRGLIEYLDEQLAKVIAADDRGDRK